MMNRQKDRTLCSVVSYSLQTHAACRRWAPCRLLHPWDFQARILEWVAFPSPGHLPDPGIKPRSPALQEDSLPTEPPAKPSFDDEYYYIKKKKRHLQSLSWFNFQFIHFYSIYRSYYMAQPSIRVSCCCSVTKSCLTFVTPWTTAYQASLSFTISQSLLKLLVHWVSGAIQPSHPLSPLLLLPSVFPRIRVFSNEFALCTKQSIGASVSASVLRMNSQGWFLLGLTGLISLQSRWVSTVFSTTTVWKHQFFGVQPSVGSNSHICTWLLEKP